jgi:hypothetical protein
LTNSQVALELEEIAILLESQGANPFRVRAYRNAARSIRGLGTPVVELAKAEGVEGLMGLPDIGRSLAHSLETLADSGRIPLLERLRGEHAPERMFATVPDIGPKLARRLHDELGIETLAELEAAANDGRLGKLRGMGKKRVQAVRESLAGRFRSRSRTETRRPGELGAPGSTAPSRSHIGAPCSSDTPAVRGETKPSEHVPVAELLDVDREYLQLAKQGQLPRIAPRRFNPTGEAWLSVLHTERAGRHYTALFSNTARAHELGAVRNWVVIYRDDDAQAGSWTVITANFGPLRGRRVVRGREDECVRHYAEADRGAEGRLVQKRLCI